MPPPPVATLRAALALAAYSALWRVLLPALFLRWAWRGRVEPGYREAWGERLGWYGAARPEASDWLWLHAVSLGETRAAAPLVEALRAARPGLRVLWTHGTATGRDAGRQQMAPGDHQVWLPVDTPGAPRRFLRRFRPQVGVLMETEVWPNLLAATREAGVPMVLASARLSERSLRAGRRHAALLQPAAHAFAAVLAQTEDDARRFRAFGAQRVEVCGNLKFDLEPPAAQRAQGARWREAAARPLVLAASTREGEEAALLEAWKAAGQGARPAAATAGALRPRLLIVPRHPQRFDEVAAQAAATGLPVARRSDWGDVPDAAALQAEIWIGDSTGEMPVYYAAADLALLGGSFAPLGGQNLIEAAACGCPVLMGPHTWNFAQAAELALAAGGAERWPDARAAVERALALIGPDAAAQQALQALRVATGPFLQPHRGAAARMAQRILTVAAGRADS